MFGIPQRCLEESLLLRSDDEPSPRLPLVPPADMDTLPAAIDGLAQPSFSITTAACGPCTSTKNLSECAGSAVVGREE